MTIQKTKITVSLFTALLFSAMLTIGCSTTTTTKETTRIPVEVDHYDHSHTGSERVETTTTITESGGCGGVLSCTVDGVGYIIALPFKLVGGLIDVIF